MDTALMSATLSLAAAFGAALVLAARRRLAPRERLRLARTMERSGVAPSALGQPGILGEVSQAVRTCLRCPQGGRCQAWLDAEHQNEFEGFCPNAGLIRRIAQG